MTAKFTNAMNKQLKERYKYTDIARILAEAGALHPAQAAIDIDAPPALYENAPAFVDLNEQAASDPVVADNLDSDSSQGIQLTIPVECVADGIINVRIDYPSRGKYTVRNSIKAGNRSVGRIVVHHNPATKAGAVVNCLTQIELEEGGKVEFVEIAATGAVLLSTILTTQAAGSDLRTVTVDIDNKTLVRSQYVALAGQGARGTLGGVYITGRGERADNYVDVRHLVPHCVSNQLFKGIIGESSDAAFTGHILVAQDAQRTAAYQQNHNIVMGDGGKVETRPQLEIYADDVKCSHGATVGKLDPEALYYMRQRGIGIKEAKRLQLEGFASEAIAMENAGELQSAILQKIALRLGEI